MTGVSRQDVVAAFGPLDDIVVAEIIATGVSREELTEARAWIAADEAMMNAGRRLPAGRLGQLIKILERIEMDPVTGSPLGEAGSTLE